LPILCKAAIDPIHNANARPIPHHEAKLNASPPAIMTITRTSSRSPPRRRLGRFADWWITVSLGVSAVFMV